MAESSNYKQPSIPKFDGHYEHWAMLMENLLLSKEYWNQIEVGIITAPAEGATQEQQKLAEESKLKDLKAKNDLFQVIDRTILETILTRNTAKEIWDSMRQKYKGSNKVKRAQLQALWKEYENLNMKIGESVENCFSRTLAIANKMSVQGETLTEGTIVEKILRSLTSRFNYAVCSIEESNDVTTMSVDQLQSSLIVQERRMKGQKDQEEQVLKMSYAGRGNRGCGNSNTRGRGRSSGEENANYAQFDEEEEIFLMAQETKDTLLMAQETIGMTDETPQNWFLDSGCSNHMIGNKEWFFDFDESYKDTVKLGDDSKIAVMDTGNLKLRIEGFVQVLTNVYYLSGLKNNLISIGQLQKKNITVIFKNDSCKVFHDDKGLIMTTHMSMNRMYIIKAPVVIPKCLKVTQSTDAQLWHQRYGHLSFKDMKILAQKKTVHGLPDVKELKPNGKKRYFITFTDDMSRKTWVYLLNEKSEALSIFQGFKAMVENESNHKILCLRTDRGGEYTSTAFNEFCDTNGIKRQLTTAYTPQQNGVSERKNKTIMNMVRLKDMTLEEAWSTSKPAVSHFRIFGCIGYVHVPDNVRKKLDDKSTICVYLAGNGTGIQRRLKRRRQQLKKLAQQENEVVLDSEDDDTNVGALGKRISKRPGYLEDFVTDDESLHSLAIFSPSEDPITYEDAAKLDKWRHAIDAEITAIESNNTWELTKLPVGAKKIGVKWIYKTKYNEQGKIEKHKARLVAKGYSQQHGIDYNEVFAPVARWDTIRSILAIAALRGWYIYQLDVKSAFLHGELNEEVYVEQPLGYQKETKEIVYKLKKSLYGLKQAPRAWYSKIESYFCHEGFEKCPHEHTLFVKHDKEDKMIVVSLYVDDLFFTGNDQRLFDKFKLSMEKNFAMTDLGRMRYFLGVEVRQDSNGIFIHQQKYAVEIMKRFGLNDCNSVCNPMVPGNKLKKDENGKAISRYMERPTEIHVAAAKRILRYLKGTISHGLWYERGKGDELIGWSDSDYAGDIDDRRSTSEYVFMIGSKPIEKRKEHCITIYCDNSSSIKLSRNPVMHGRSKHVDVRFHFLRDLTKDGVIQLKHCSSFEQVADIITKALSLESFCKIRDKLGVLSLDMVN
ncbi:hypothetical protein TSUD_400940 [Trifolium subterraneum]|uniref:Integrase catalytic domain-containing protein n=1 Tax=Trifolium subterraneum TaxID=3900 RepID=A0A2Z6NU46_TRISU|nr:hypothetical protein TSUD_400940 [Trifolium subterraneum]